jgi:hypothetical protein
VLAPLPPLCVISKLSGTKLRDLQFLTERRKLRFLKLSGTKLRDLQFLTKRRKLRFLSGIILLLNPGFVNPIV